MEILEKMRCGKGENVNKIVETQETVFATASFFGEKGKRICKNEGVAKNGFAKMLKRCEFSNKGKILAPSRILRFSTFLSTTCGKVKGEIIHRSIFAFPQARIRKIRCKCC